MVICRGMAFFSLILENIMMDSSTKESSMDMELLHSKIKTNYK